MGFLKTDVLGDHRLEYQIAEVLTQLFFNVFGHVRAVREGAQYAQDLQIWFELVLLHHIDGLLQLHQPGEGEKARGHGDDEPVAGHKGVDRQQPQRRGIVNDDVIVLLLELAQRTIQSLAAIVKGVSQLQVCAGEPDVRGDKMQVVECCLLDYRRQRGELDDHVVEGLFRDDLHVRVYEHARGVGLGIRVDQQHLVTFQRQSGRQVDGGRALGDPSLLVSY